MAAMIALFVMNVNGRHHLLMLVLPLKDVKDISVSHVMFLWGYMSSSDVTKVMLQVCFSDVLKHIHALQVHIYNAVCAQ